MRLVRNGCVSFVYPAPIGQSLVGEANVTLGELPLPRVPLVGLSNDIVNTVDAVNTGNPVHGREQLQTERRLESVNEIGNAVEAGLRCPSAA